MTRQSCKAAAPPRRTALSRLARTSAGWSRIALPNTRSRPAHRFLSLAPSTQKKTKATTTKRAVQNAISCGDANATTPQPDCPLFKLPGELRNVIYSYVAAARNRNFGDAKRPYIYVDATGFDVPALLSTCKVIRTEAAPIFYAENEFLLQCYAWDPTVTLRFNEAVRKIQKLSKFSVNFRWAQGAFARNWTNLKLWLEYLATGRLDRRFYPDMNIGEDGRDMYVVRLACRYVGNMKWKAWEKLQSDVEEYHELLVDLDSRWK